MSGTVIWLVLIGSICVLELLARTTHRVVGPSDLIHQLARRAHGRVALLVFWAFVGWHLFARYTIVR